MVPNDASGSEPPYVFAQRSLLKTKDALSRDFKGGSLRSRLFSTTPLASFLGSLPFLSQEGAPIPHPRALYHHRYRLQHSALRYLRSDRKPARTSSEKICGCSQAAK